MINMVLSGLTIYIKGVQEFALSCTDTFRH